METHFYSVPIRVLVSREGNEFSARALELDLLGYGRTAEEAVEQLRSAVEAQISFAHQMGSPELLGFPAEQEYFARWEQAQKDGLRARLLGDRPVRVKARACFINFTDEEIRSMARGRRFRPTELSCA
jgi:hypothetical protein